MRLSILVPVYNEENTVGEVLSKISKVKFPSNIQTEIIVVDDGSTDHTAQKLTKVDNAQIYWQKHSGKGAAIKNALGRAKGDYCIVQDADLEYDPQEIPKLLEPILRNSAKVVYGSRNLKINPRSSLAFFWGGVFLSKLINLLHTTKLSDESTGYKLIETKLFRALNIQANGFEFCPEITVKILKKGIKIWEVPISYKPRDFEAGKKIRATDGLIAIWTILKFSLIK